MRKDRQLTADLRQKVGAIRRVEEPDSQVTFE
jgi:hypothetical protein